MSGFGPFQQSKIELTMTEEEQSTVESSHPGMKSEKFNSAQRAINKQKKVSVLSRFWKRGSEVAPGNRSPVIPSPDPL